MVSIKTLRVAGAALGMLMATGAVTTDPAMAARTIFNIGADFSTNPYTFAFDGGKFTFTGTGDIFAPTAVSSGGTGEFNTIFGTPTSDFVNRGKVTFGPADQYSAFANPTAIFASNGDNFIGLEAMSGGKTYYGYAFTTNDVLNTIGFEGVAGRAVTATTALAVPEAANWMMMIAGFGAIGAVLRRRRDKASFAQA